MQNNQVNIAFNQLPLEAFSLDGQEPVKGAHWVDCASGRAFTRP